MWVVSKHQVCFNHIMHVFLKVGVGVTQMVLISEAEKMIGRGEKYEFCELLRPCNRDKSEGLRMTASGEP